MLGSGGAGKSSFATALGRATGLPVTHLDVLFWRPGWTPAPIDEAVRDLATVVDGPRWVLDGNFLDHAEADGRFRHADTVVFLDLPRRVCLWRVLRRLATDRRRRRADLPDGCAESLDPDGLRWIWRYPRHDRPKVLAILDRLGPNVSVHRLRDRAAAQRYLDALRQPT